MRIRKKIAVIVTIISLGLYLSGSIFMSIFFFDGLNRQETLDINNKIRNLSIYIREQSASLVNTLNDWAKWDDTYQFIMDGNRQYVDLNLNVESIQNLNMSFMLFFNKNGGVVHRVRYIRETGTIEPFPDTLMERVNSLMDTAFLEGSPFMESTGILFDGDDCYLIARASVTNSAMSVEPNGVLFTGRKFSSDMLTAMRSLTAGDIKLLPVGALDESLQKQLNAAKANEQGLRIVTVNQSSSELTSYMAVTLNGLDTGAVLAMKDGRLIFRTGLHEHGLMVLIYLALVVLILAVLMRALHIFAIRPVTDMIDEISAIEPDANPPKRLVVRGRNELAMLSQSINGLLGKIEDSYREIDRRKVQFSSLIGEMKQGFALHEAITDADGSIVDFMYVYANESYRRIMDLSQPDIAGMRFSEVFPGYTSVDGWIQRLSLVIADPERNHINEQYERGDRYLELSAFRPQPMQCAVLLTDITERRKAELELEHISYHDQLTGLYNRRYFERAMRMLDTPENLPLSIVICDMNGLKFTNDAFGHETGDKILLIASQALLEFCRQQDVVARWGGDEFTIMLPRTSHADTVSICMQIKERINKIELNSMTYSMSMGYGTKTRQAQDIQKLLQQAEDHMYRSKITENMPGHGNAIHAIMTTFQERNEREREHSSRVSRLCRLIAEAMEMSYEQVADMELAGLVHDIGKIAINDAIVNKQGKLTNEEWLEMKRHPEIGFRILNASGEMTVIAQYVLAHHERWDGSGYPKGIAGREIPLQARILAVADSYDAITSERPYKQKLDVKDAVAELRRCAGRHFDPEVVRAFICGVLGYCFDENAESAHVNEVKVG